MRFRFLPVKGPGLQASGLLCNRNATRRTGSPLQRTSIQHLTGGNTRGISATHTRTAGSQTAARLVSEGPVRNVHSLGALLPARTARMGHEPRAHPGRGVRTPRADVEARSGLPEGVGEARQRLRHALHGDDHQAPRGLLPVRLEAHRLQRRQMRPRPGPRRGIRRGRARRRVEGRLLLLDDGLASPRRRPLQEGRGRAAQVRGLHPRAGPRTVHQLRQGGHHVVRRFLAAGRGRLGVGEDERDGARAAAGHHHQRPLADARGLRHARAAHHARRGRPRLGGLHDLQRKLGLHAD